MATRAYHIVSHYEPPAGKESDLEEDIDEGWSKGHTSGLSKRLLHPPTFVKPSGAYDEYGRPVVPEDDEEIQFIEHRPANLGQWYKSLSRTNSDGFPSEPTPRTSTPPIIPYSRPPPSDRTPWFISNVVQKTRSHESPSSAIGEMLSRAPPPLPSEEPFVPPVWTVLGPTNRGYSMLEKRGWQEGESLGPALPQTPCSGVVTQEEDRVEGSDCSASTSPGHRRPNGMEKETDTIDLTLSSDNDEIMEPGSIQRESSGSSDLPHGVSTNTTPSRSGRALLTPLPTVFRADKSGIGKKGLTKTITQTAEAIRLHARTIKKRKRRPYDGPHFISQGGAKAIIKRTKDEQRDRAALMAYMREG